MASADGVSNAAAGPRPSAKPAWPPAKVVTWPSGAMRRMQLQSPPSATNTLPWASTTVPNGSPKRPASGVTRADHAGLVGASAGRQKARPGVASWRALKT